MKHRPSELGQCWLGAHVHFSLCFPRYNISRFCISEKFFTNPCMFFSCAQFFPQKTCPPPSPRTTSIHAHSALNLIHPCTGRVFGQPEDWIGVIGKSVGFPRVYCLLFLLPALHGGIAHGRGCLMSPSRAGQQPSPADTQPKPLRTPMAPTTARRSDPQC